MAKRRAKKTSKKLASSTESQVPIADEKIAFADQDVERQIAVIRTMRDAEIEQLLTGLRLLRSSFSKEQLQTPLLQFFEKNLPNLVVVRNGKDGRYEVKWKDKDSNFSKADEENINASLLHGISIAYPDFSALMPSLGGLEFSNKGARAGLLAADNTQMRDFALEEPTDAQMLGLPDFLQTPGVSSQRLSVGMTPKTVRLPKHGEMLLSVHGSPLGVYKEDNMEAIHESEEE